MQFFSSNLVFSNPIFAIGFDLNQEPIHLEDEHHLFDLNMELPFVGGLGMLLCKAVFLFLYVSF
jgi:hypothetical protein